MHFGRHKYKVVSIAKYVSLPPLFIYCSTCMQHRTCNDIIAVSSHPTKRFCSYMDSSCIYLQFPSIWFEFHSKPLMIKTGFTLQNAILRDRIWLKFKKNCVAQWWLWGVCRVESVLISSNDFVWSSGPSWWHRKELSHILFHELQ